MFLGYFTFNINISIFPVIFSQLGRRKTGNLAKTMFIRSTVIQFPFFIDWSCRGEGNQLRHNIRVFFYERLLEQLYDEGLPEEEAYSLDPLKISLLLPNNELHCSLFF